MNSDPLGLGGFNTQALHAPTGPALKVAPKQGLLGRIGSSVVQPFETLGKAVVNTPDALVRELQNKPINDIQQKTFGTTNSGQIAKQIGGDLAQVGGTFIGAPEVEGGAKAGLAARAVAGARGGAVIGAGSALANNQNILKGAGLGALGGAALAPAASVAGKALGIGGKVANTALTGKIGSAASDELENVPKPTIGQKLTNSLVNKGNRMQAKLGSFAPGQKVGGQQLDTQASNKILNTLRNEGVNKIGAPEQLEQVEDKINDLGQAHGTLTETNNVPLTAEDKQLITSEVNDRLTNPNNPKFQAGGSSPSVQKFANNYTNDINNADDLAALSRQKTGLDQNEINYKSTADAATNARNIAAKTTRNVINDFMNSKIPGLSTINGRLSNLFDAKGALMNASGSLANKVTGSEGLTGRLLTSETAEQGKAALAKGLQKTGTALGGKGSATEPILGDINATDGTIPFTSNAKSPIPSPAKVTPAVNPAKVASRIQEIDDTLAVARKSGSVLANRGLEDERQTLLDSLKTAPAPTPEISTTPTKIATGSTPPPTPPIPTETPTPNPTAVPKAPGTINSILGSLTGATPNVARLGVAGALGNPPAQAPTQSLSATDIANDIAPAQTPPTQASESEDSPYPEENMLYDIENDPKNASTYESLYTLLNPKPSASATSLDATQQKEVAAGEAAITNLQQYAQQLNTAGAGGNIGTGTLSTLLGKYLPSQLSSSSEKQAAALSSSGHDVAYSLAQALSGGNKPSSTFLQGIEESLPNISDSPEERADKINSLITRMQSTLQIYATPVSQLASGITGQQTTNGSVGSNLDSLLGSLSGAQ